MADGRKEDNRSEEKGAKGSPEVEGCGELAVLWHNNMVLAGVIYIRPLYQQVCFDLDDSGNQLIYQERLPQLYC